MVAVTQRIDNSPQFMEPIMAQALNRTTTIAEGDMPEDRSTLKVTAVHKNDNKLRKIR